MIGIGSENLILKLMIEFIMEFYRQLLLTNHSLFYQSNIINAERASRITFTTEILGENELNVKDELEYSSGSNSMKTSPSSVKSLPCNSFILPSRDVIQPKSA